MFSSKKNLIQQVQKEIKLIMERTKLTKENIECQIKEKELNKMNSKFFDSCSLRVNKTDNTLEVFDFKFLMEIDAIS